MKFNTRKKLISILSAVISLAIAAAAVPAIAAAPSAPVLSAEGGIYGEAFSLSISGEGDIYYTTDGSVPTRASNRYTSPINIRQQSGSYPKATTIRAAAFSGSESSPVVSGTYFVGNNTSTALGNVPIVNLVVEPYDLWDPANGIYSNYNYEHKVPAVFHYITPDGKTDINRNVEIKISGHGSRSAAKKSFRVYFKKTDPDQGKYLEYNLVPEANVDYYANINFRISDWQKTNFRDTLAQQIGKQTRAQIAESTPMALYLNGEYWGLYETREHYNDEYFASHYGLDKDTIVYLDRDWQRSLDETVIDGVTYYDKLEYSEGPADGNKDGVLGETYYRNQWAYIKSLAVTKDITSDEVYEEFCSYVDIDNFIDYLITYIYCANDDWPGNNFKFWRVTEEAADGSTPLSDGKWRFMIHDFDIAFDDINHDTLYLSTRQKDANTEARHPKYATDLLDNLLRNAEFRNEFAQRTAVYISTIMGKDSVDAIVDRLVAERSAAKPLDITRWNLGGTSRWNIEVNWLHRYANERPAKLREQYRNNLNLYYGAGITGEAKAGVSSTTDYLINGAPMAEGDSGELTLFAGIPLTIEAENSDITVICDGESLSGTGSLTFTPENKTYKINITDVKELTLIYTAEGTEISRETVEAPCGGSFTHNANVAAVHNGKLYTIGDVTIEDMAEVGGEYIVNLAETDFTLEELTVNTCVGEAAELPGSVKLFYDGGELELQLSFGEAFTSDEIGAYTVTGSASGISVPVTVKVYGKWPGDSDDDYGRATRVTVRFVDSDGSDVAAPVEALVPTGSSFGVTDELLKEYPHLSVTALPDPIVTSEPVHEIYVGCERLSGVFGSLSADLEDGGVSAKAKVINTSGAEAKALLIAARYDGDMLVEAKTERITLPANSDDFLELDLTLPLSDGDDVRVYLWDGELRPLCEAVSL